MSAPDFSAFYDIARTGVHPRLFCLEAGDKTGKSTLADNLVPWLGSRGHEARVFREPGGSPRAEELRPILKNRNNGLTPAEAAEMFFEAREDLLRTTLLPWLAADKNRVAILDRYFWSTIVYQGVMAGLDMGWLAGLTRQVCKGAIPVRTFMLDLDPAVIAKARSLARKAAGRLLGPRRRVPRADNPSRRRSDQGPPRRRGRRDDPRDHRVALLRAPAKVDDLLAVLDQSFQGFA